MNKWRSGLCVLLSLFISAFAANSYGKDVSKIRFPPMQSDDDVSHSYFVNLLNASLAVTEQQYGPAKVEVLPTQYDQRLILSLLNHEGILDVVASAPTAEREKSFRSSRVPLLMGLLSYRMLLIRKDKLAEFKSITEAAQLQQLRACSAEHWPDTDILLHNQYQVQTGAGFQQLFDMLVSGKCDYFPRGITEGYAELQAFDKHHPELAGQLVAFDDVLIHYPLAVMFYTSHHNFELAGRIEKGLWQLHQNGQLLSLLKSHPSTARAFPLTQWQGSKVFELTNPYMPNVVAVENDSLWLTFHTPQK